MRLEDNLIVAQEWQLRNAGGKEMKLDVGDSVWLATRHIRSTCPCKNLDCKRTGPFMVSQVINDEAYRLDLSAKMHLHNVFHVSLLDCYMPPVKGQHVAKSQPMIVDDSEQYEVERILNSKRRYRKLYYHVQWAGYNYLRTMWELVQNLENAQDPISEFHAANPAKPR